jgi:hypothetical protein
MFSCLQIRPSLCFSSHLIVTMRLLICTLLLGVSVVLSEAFVIPTKSHHQRLPTAPLSFPSKLQLQIQPMQSPPLASVRGGSSSSSSSSTSLYASDPEETKCPVSKPLAIFGSLWGSLGVVYILAKAIKRVLPIAMEPFGASSTLVLTPVQWRYGTQCNVKWPVLVLVLVAKRSSLQTSLLRTLSSHFLFPFLGSTLVFTPPVACSLPTPKATKAFN